MKTKKITPVILAGGSGTRLWPISREDLPKQFCALDDKHSLFQKSILRVCDNDVFKAPVIVTGARYAEIVSHQLREIDCHARAIICEPCARDTAAAVCLAVELPELDTDELMIVVPSDHLMGDEPAFLRAVTNAADSAVNDGLIITFGIKPSYPETGFGYLKAGDALFNRAVCKLEGFIEKPDKKYAEQLLQNPSVFWNAGIFMFERRAIQKEFLHNANRVASCVRKSIAMGHWDHDCYMPNELAFEATPSISFDYAVMENTNKAATIPVDPVWSDLGSWKAMWEIADRDINQNAVGDHCFVDNARDCLVRSEGPVIGVSGVDDIVVIADKDAVLVTSRDNPQGVKKLVDSMKAASVMTATRHAGEDRPWGRFDSLDKGHAHQVKRLQVKPGEQLSLQYHHHRSEYWIVVNGTATVTLDNEVRDLMVGEQTFIPKGAVHRLENKSRDLVEIIEVQIGPYLGEDDIVRIEDKYGRPDIGQNRSSGKLNQAA